MKRTGEIVLGVIGIVVYAFFTLLGALMVWIENNKEQVKDLMDEVSKDNPENAVSTQELNEALESMGSSGWVLFFSGLAIVVLGIVSLVFLKGNKRPKPAGIILIVLGVLSVVLLGGLAIIGAIPYIIAGIMCLVRKPTVPISELE